MITLPGEIHKASFLDFLLKIFNCIIKCIEISGDSFLENDYFLDPDLLRDKESLNPMLSLYGVWVMLWDKYINYRKEMLNISNKGNFSKPEVVYTPDFETSLLSEEPELGDNMPEKNIVSDDNTEMTRKHITGYGRKMFLGFLGIGILVLVATFGLCEPIININLFEYIHGVDHTFYFANIVLNRYLLNIFASNDFIMSKFMIWYARVVVKTTYDSLSNNGISLNGYNLNHINIMGLYSKIIERVPEEYLPLRHYPIFHSEIERLVLNSR